MRYRILIKILKKQHNETLEHKIRSQFALLTSEYMRRFFVSPTSDFTPNITVTSPAKLQLFYSLHKCPTLPRQCFHVFLRRLIVCNYTKTFRFLRYKTKIRCSFAKVFKEDIIDYLNKLGVSDCYTSPLLTARPGSNHGYDVIDHSEINPEIGSIMEVDTLSKELQSKRNIHICQIFNSFQEMGLLVDIVPNHMGVSDSGNRLWMSVLEHGRASVYSDFFDIDWTRPGSEGKLMVPNLGGPLGTVVENGEIQVIYHEDTHSFRFKYYGLQLPIDPHSYPIILNPIISALSAQSVS